MISFQSSVIFFYDNNSVEICDWIKKKLIKGMLKRDNLKNSVICPNGNP